jgi:hypothetical protein
MSKRLVLLFCAVLALAFAVPAFAAVQNVKVSGDIIARHVVRNDFDLLKDSADDKDDISVFNSVVRLRVDADLTDNVQTTIRLINERNWDEASAANTDIDLDLAYVTLKEFLYSPLTVTLGRQELHFGNDMIIGDGVGNPSAAIVSGGIGTNQTTNYTEASGFGGVNGDLAYRKAFDAVRATLNYDPLVIDLVFAKIDENNVISGSNSDDKDLWGANAGYKFSDKWNTLAEGYIWSKMNYAGANSSSVDKTDRVHTIGARVSTNPMQKVNLQQELAYQFGKKVVSAGVGRDRSAWASQTIATVTPGWKHDPVIGLMYSYFSGDAALTATNPDKDYHQWDPMFENQTSGHIINALFSSSNAHNINTNLTLKPSFLEDVTIRGDYVYQLLAKGLASPVTGDFTEYDSTGYRYKAQSKSIGQEFDLNLIYDYTEDVQIGLLLGWFWPGAAINKTLSGGSLEQGVTANEVIASCAVKF